MANGKVLRVGPVSLVVASLHQERAFYEGLGFRAVGERTLGGEEASARFGMAATQAEIVEMRLGAQRIELVALTPPGRPYPEPRAANDPWFQHFAIAVSDMDAAYERLSRVGAAPISTGGPQLLPPSTGSVTAYKFRDPEGHPLELSLIPGSAWTRSPPGPAAPFLGVDHTALAVSDLQASVAFYTGVLGFTLEAQLLNRGPEQDRLDGLPGVKLDIAVLRPEDRSGPHLELLAYRAPASASGARSVAPNDLAATRTRLEIESAPAWYDRLRAEGMDVERTGDLTSGELLLIIDPDGHRLELAQGVPVD